MLKRVSVVAAAVMAGIFLCSGAEASLPDFSEPAGMYAELTYYYADGTTAKETKSQYGMFDVPFFSLGSPGLPSVSVNPSGSEFNGRVGDYGLTKVTATTVVWDTYWITGDFDQAKATVGSMVEGGFGVGTDAGSSSASMGVLAAAFDPDDPLPPEAVSALYVTKRGGVTSDGIPVTDTQKKGVGYYAYNEGTFPSAAEHDFGYIEYGLTFSPDDPMTLLWGSTYTLETSGGSAAAALDYRHMPGPPFELYAGNASYDNVRSYAQGDRLHDGAPVPEPATVTMLGLGLLGLAGLVRRKSI